MAIAPAPFWTTPTIAGENPTHNIRGSNRDAAGNLTADDSINRTVAQTLFPAYNGTSHILPDKPADFGDSPANLDPASFIQWHSAHQMEYLELNAVNTPVYETDPNPPTSGVAVGQAAFITIGNSATLTENIHVYLSTDRSRVVILNSLQPHEIPKLPLADQIAIANHPAYRTLIGDAYNLVPNTANPYPGTIRDGLVETIDEQISLITSTFRRFDTGFFVAQLEFLKDDLSKMAIFDISAIEEKSAEILERFSRVNRYAEALRHNPSDKSNGVYSSLSSTDRNESLKAGFELFLRMEGRLFDLATVAREVASTGKLNERTLDVPGMTFTFQTYENYEAEAVSEIKTETIKQRNKLLKDYATMQKLVNDTLELFDPAKLVDPDDTEELRLLKRPDNSDRNTFTLTKLRAISMFDRTVLVDARHPIETEENISRPTEDIYNPDNNAAGEFAEYNKNVWDGFATNLSEGAKLISQGTQLIMDEINAINKEKNRHFQLATNTIKKMSDIIKMITQPGD